MNKFFSLKSFLKETNDRGGEYITHWEILRTERFGSRDGEVKLCRCGVCGKEDDGNFFVDDIGEVFCSVKCRLSKMKSRRG